MDGLLWCFVFNLAIYTNDIPIINSFPSWLLKKQYTNSYIFFGNIFPILLYSRYQKSKYHSFSEITVTCGSHSRVEADGGTEGVGDLASRVPKKQSKTGITLPKPCNIWPQIKLDFVLLFLHFPPPSG